MTRTAYQKASSIKDGDHMQTTETETTNTNSKL
jgi:hypothetical protein